MVSILTNKHNIDAHNQQKTIWAFSARLEAGKVGETAFKKKGGKRTIFSFAGWTSGGVWLELAAWLPQWLGASRAFVH